MEFVHLQKTWRGYQIAIESISAPWDYPAHFPCRSEAEIWARDYHARDLAWNQSQGRTYGNVILELDQ
jgi:hypothetical protein